MTYQINEQPFSPALFSLALCFLQLSVFMIHSMASWEKTQWLNQHENSVRLPNVSQESPGNCPGLEVTAHRRPSIVQRWLSTEVWEGRVPLVFPLFAMVILIIWFALMLFVCHQGTMARLGCTLETFAGRTKEPCWSVLQKRKWTRRHQFCGFNRTLTKTWLGGFQN